MSLAPVARFLLPLLATLVAMPALPAADPDRADARCRSDLPATMRAVRLHALGGPEQLVLDEMPVPVPAAGEVLVRVHYASVNPVDWKLQLAGALKFPAVPGGDLAGEIVVLGDGVDGWQCGDAVVAVVNQRSRQGSYAEYVPVPVTEMVRKPVAYSWREAAAYPTVGIAAWRYLVSAARVAAGDRVLVHGGAGGVGSMAVQIAKAKGAYVIATASERNLEYLRQVGADEVIDYRATRFEDVVREVDVVMDTVGGDTLARSGAVLRQGGRIVSTAGRVPDAICASGTVECPATPPWDVQFGLSSLAPLIEAGKLKVNVERVFPLAEAAEAQALNRAGHTRGKIVLQAAD